MNSVVSAQNWLPDVAMKSKRIFYPGLSRSLISAKILTLEAKGRLDIAPAPELETLRRRSYKLRKSVD
jgi:hypothetical protein